MAIGTVYGSTLSDLQSGKNAAIGADYARANAQDKISQDRLEAFLRLQGEKYAIQAQQNTLAAGRAMRMAELAQQDKQFGTSEANRMALGKLEAETQLGVAKETSRGMAPGIFENALAFNQQEEAKAAQSIAASARRKALVAEIKAANDYHYAWANGQAYEDWKSKVGSEPDAKRATSDLNTLDTQSAANGFSLSPDGGYNPYVPKLITLPGSKGVPAINPNNPTVAPPANPPAQPGIPAMLQGNTITNIGGYDVVPGGAFDRIINGPVAPPVDALVPSMVAPRPTLRWDGNNWVQ